jgi:hypothetical protein
MKLRRLEIHNGSVIKNYSDYVNRFDNDFCNDLESILVWFSGKNFLAAIGQWITSTGSYANPGAFRAILRDWVRSNREAALEIIPEWGSLLICWDASRARFSAPRYLGEYISDALFR